MNRYDHRSRSRILVTPLLLAVLALACIWPATNSILKAQTEPASEGRPITPAGRLVEDLTTRHAAVGALPVTFLRSPDSMGSDGKGRYLLAVNSGFGLQFNAATNRAQQSLAVIDLAARPHPVVVQNIYFPTPQSACVGAAFGQEPDQQGRFSLYVSGGVENKIWIFQFLPGARSPITPASTGPDTKVTAPFIDINGFSSNAPTPRYNEGYAPVYPAGLALSADGQTLFVANNLGDSVGVIRNLNSTRDLTRLDLKSENSTQFVYPYGVALSSSTSDAGTGKAYVSCWGDGTIAVIDVNHLERPLKRITVGRHPTSMLFGSHGRRLFVVNSNGDSVSVLDASTDSEVERIDVRLSESSLIGSSPEGLALSEDGKTLFVANAHSNSVGVIELSARARGEKDEKGEGRSVLRGFIPTGQYPSAIAAIGDTLIVGNGKGTGVENSGSGVLACWP